jgi:hypothetical protein
VRLERFSFHKRAIRQQFIGEMAIKHYARLADLSEERHTSGELINEEDVVFLLLRENVRRQV